nr:TnsA endonuclease N-terminal domain-containing protein [Candidatus Sigynarchaeota archaeon]
MEDLDSSRKIPRSRRANTGFFPSKKVKSGIVDYESRIERDFYILLNHDPSVVQFQHQPEIIEWTDSKGKHHEYTTDVLVIMKDGKRILVEIKPEDEIESIIDQFKEAWIAADTAAKQRGCEFLIITDKMIRGARFNNVWFCLGASRLRFNDYEHEITQVENVVSRFEDGIEYKTLCEEIARMLGCRIDIAAQFVT